MTLVARDFAVPYEARTETIPLTFLLVQADRWWCPMCPAIDGAWGWGMMFLMLLFWVAVIALVV